MTQAQDCHNSNALAQDLQQSCAEPLAHWHNSKLTYFWSEGIGVAVEAGLDGPCSFLLVRQIVGTIVTVAVVTKLAIGKTVTVPEEKQGIGLTSSPAPSHVLRNGGKCIRWYDLKRTSWLGLKESNIFRIHNYNMVLLTTYSLRHWDLVQLHGFRGRCPAGSATTELERNQK